MLNYETTNPKVPNIYTYIGSKGICMQINEQYNEDANQYNEGEGI